MRIKTFDDYVRSLKELKAEVFVRGEKVEDITSHPLIIPHINCAGMTYELACKDEYADLLLCKSHITGETISRFTHIHQSIEDLVKKVKMMRFLGQKTGSCFQRCVGFDGLNAVYATTYEIDKKCGTDYHRRFVEYLKYVQSENLMVAGAMTDAKGQRGLKPSQQFRRDFFVRVKEKYDEGIVVEGAKMHITGAVNSHEILVMPTMALNEEDKDYAVCFAVPVNAKGVKMILGRQATDARRFEGGEIDTGNLKYGVVGGEALIVFEDVFVPRDRIFMCGEYEFAGILVERFASLHRQNYGGCKVGVADVLVGASALLAEYHGVDKAHHIKEKITEMILLAETLYASSLACSYEGKATESGAYMPDYLLANVTKQNTTRFIYEIMRLSHDIAGGFIATLPSEMDLKSSLTRRFVEKYYTTHPEVPAEHRIRLARLIENMTSGTPQVEAMHGAGSPQTQRVMIMRQANIEEKKALALEIAGIKKK